MGYLISKFLISAAVLVIAAEIAKRSSLLGAIISSLPLVSILAMIWLYQDTKNPLVVANLSSDIFWMVLPSLILFISLPLLLQHKLPFYTALILSCIIMLGCYFIMVFVLKKWGIIKF